MGAIKEQIIESLGVDGEWEPLEATESFEGQDNDQLALADFPSYLRPVCSPASDFKSL